MISRSHRLSVTLLLAALAAAVVTVPLSSAPGAGVAAFSPPPARSSFGGNDALLRATAARNGSTMDMKKGKPNVPVQMRGQYRKQQEMASMQREMIAATKPSDDGLPVFNLFVRTKRQNVRFVWVWLLCVCVEV